VLEKLGFDSQQSKILLFSKAQKVISKRMVTNGCASSSVGLQTSSNDGNRHFILSHVSAGEFVYQSQLCIWLSMKLHIFGMESAVFFFYMMMFTAVGK
jgi:hypothetical protein